MRIFSAIILITALSSYAGTATLTNNSWISFNFSSVPPFNLLYKVYHDPSGNISCTSITDSTDFYWMYEEGCLCMCSCCPTINIASKRPFYISKHAMNYSDYHDDTAKLTDTSLFIKCDTSEYPMWTQCPPQQQFSSIIFLTKALTVGFVSNVDSLYKRLLVFGIRFPFPRALNFIPLKIDHVDSTTYYCPFDPGTSTRYDSIHITFEKSLISTKTLPIQNFKNLRNPFHITNTRQGYVISGYHNGYLEIIDGQGKTVYHQFVFAPSCLIGKNVLRPGIYFFQMHNQAGTSSIKLPVF